jgi:shikimate kinase
MKNIVLIGFKAAGKSSAGKALAALLDLPFIDTDAVTERLYQERHGESLSCREIYSHLGEEAMRALEMEALHGAAHGGRSVIATGGGAVLHQNTRQLLKEAGFCVFLDTPLPVLEQRLAPHKDSPLFAHKSVSQVHGERYRLYSSTADVCLMPEPDEEAEAIAQRIQQHLKGTVYGQQ